MNTSASAQTHTPSTSSSQRSFERHERSPVYEEQSGTPSRVHRSHRSHRSHSSRAHAVSPSDRYIVGGQLPPPFPSPPPAASPRIPRDSMQAQQDAIGSLFGSGQRVDMYGSSAGAPQAPSPPPYDSQSNIDAESLPSYKKEVPYDAELSRKLFWYGFVFFPLWLVGILAPFVTPSRPDPSTDNRSKEDWDAELINMRKEETKWAWRCGFALTGFVFCVIVAVIIAVTVAGKH